MLSKQSIRGNVKILLDDEVLTKDQIDQIKSYNSLFGTKMDGISRTLSRVYIKKLFRKYEKNLPPEIQEFSDNNSRRWGGGLCEILFDK